MNLLRLIFMLFTYPGKVADATNKARDKAELDEILFKVC